MTAQLEKWQFRDPADVAERIESGTCQGCAFILRLTVSGELVESCGRHRRHGKKCGDYLEALSGK